MTLVRMRYEPTRDDITDAVETVLDSALVEVVVTQDGHPSTLDWLVRLLDNNGLINRSVIRPRR